MYWAKTWRLWRETIDVESPECDALALASDATEISGNKAEQARSIGQIGARKDFYKTLTTAQRSSKNNSNQQQIAAHDDRRRGFGMEWSNTNATTSNNLRVSAHIFLTFHYYIYIHTRQWPIATQMPNRAR